MEEIRGYSNVLMAVDQHRDKINEIVKWINAEEERHRKALEYLEEPGSISEERWSVIHVGWKKDDLKKVMEEFNEMMGKWIDRFKKELTDPKDETLENIGQCLKAYEEREESIKDMSFNRAFGMGDNGCMTVTIIPYVMSKGFQLAVAVNRREH